MDQPLQYFWCAYHPRASTLPHVGHGFTFNTSSVASCLWTSSLRDSFSK
jgi:hypothetical protein